MKANAYLQYGLLTLLGTFSLACSRGAVEEEVPAPQAVRASAVRITTLQEGRTHLAEVIPLQRVHVIAQVPGTVTVLSVEEGSPVKHGKALVRISAPDVAARVARVHSERKRAERERDFVCSTVKADRVLAQSGDLASIALERSERGCASAELAAEGARAGEREASVAKARGVERAPFDGEVLALLVDEGQTVMPGTPLLQYASRERLLRLRIPESDLVGIKVGALVSSDIGLGHVKSIGTQAMGAGRVIELLIEMEAEINMRVGATLNIVLVRSKVENACAVPEEAISGSTGEHYVLVIEGDRLRKIPVTPGVREDGWTAVSPALAKGTLVVASAVSTLDTKLSVWVVRP